MTEKIVLAYSGGLDTSVMLHWLKENYHCDIIACIVDVGQKENFVLLRERAKQTGATKVYIIDAKKEFVRDYIFPTLKANAIYEGKYLLATALARPLIASKVCEIAKKENAFAVSHGATGKGNDQVRFELSFKALLPKVKIIAPWREWELKSREDELLYAKKFSIPIVVKKDKPYSIDANLWHISYEGSNLENIGKVPDEDIFQWTVSLEKSPDRPTFVSITFNKGIPIKLNGKKYSPVELIQKLNCIAGKNAIGRVDLVENRITGLKSRGVYECPAATVLYTAHRELELITLDRETLHYKVLIGQKYAELVYYGLWFTPLKEALDAFVEKTQEFVSGVIELKLYKGNITVVSRKSLYSLYHKKIATFGKTDIALYDQRDAKGFINLFGLPIKLHALIRRGK